MKNAIVTGASTGIGRATALKLASVGYHVFLVARSEEKLQETARMIVENSNSAEVLVADLSQLAEIQRVITTILSQVETVDCIANIAGIWHGKDEVYANKNYQDFDQRVIVDTYMVGMMAPSLLVHGLLPKMPSGSKIVNLSGTFENGAKGWLPYYSSKKAIEDFTVGLSQELEDRNIQVNAVSPSDTSTEEYAKYFPQYIDEAISPEEIANEIAELCEESNRTTGVVMVMKQGQKPINGFHT